MDLPPCIRCDRTLEPVFDNMSDINQPSGGLSFEAHGHYGSAFYDPINVLGSPRQHIEINVCDPCLFELVDQGYILHVETVQHRTQKITTYDPSLNDN